MAFRQAEKPAVKTMRIGASPFVDRSLPDPRHVVLIIILAVNIAKKTAVSLCGNYHRFGG
jgi:hypothetical protein